MKDSKRDILKQLLSGRLSLQEAVERLQSEDGHCAILIVISTAEGLYSLGKDTGLTHDQMTTRTKGKVHVILDEDDALLGVSGPAADTRLR